MFSMTKRDHSSSVPLSLKWELRADNGTHEDIELEFLSRRELKTIQFAGGRSLRM